MKLIVNRRNVALTLLLLLMLSFVHIPISYSTQTTAPDEVLKFLEDVVNLDLSKYDIELLGTTISNSAELGGLAQLTGKYTLQSKTSQLDVIFKFTNNSLHWCLLRPMDGSPHYKIEPLADIQNKAIDFLERYQTYTGDSELNTMKNVLETVDSLKNTTRTLNNIKLSVSSTAESTCFNWKQSINGADYAGLMVNFRNGQFYSFNDIRNIYTTGGTAVNISKEAAIVLAHKYAENLIWTVGSEEVTNFTIMEETTDPELLTRSRGDALTLYPYWYVLVYLGELYPGNIRHIQIMFWADTGELIDCQPLSFGGGSSQETVNTETLASTEPSSFTTQQNEVTSLSSYTTIIALAIATIFATVIIAIVYKKKCK